MNRSPAQVVRYLMQAGWRRRWLLVIPVLIMLPVGLLATKFMPLTYVSRSLMLLQESAETGPLAREPTNAQFITNEERLAALRALLLSDRVMGAVIDDFGITDPKLRATKIRDLRQDVWLEGAGTNFIEIYHSGPSPVGLGKQLENIMARFLQALVPNEDEPDAIQILLDKHTRDLAAARATKVDLERRLSALSIQDPVAAEVELGELGREREAKAQELREAEEAVERARPSGMLSSATIVELQQEVDRLTGSKASDDGTSMRAEEVGPLRDALGRRKAVLADQEKIAAAIATEQRKISDYERLKAEIAATEREIATEEQQLDATRKRLDSVRLMSVTGILRAPELIRIVDPPRDPEFPTRSPLIYLLAALAAGAVLGLGLASIAEFLDTRLRDPEDFSEIAGVPVITRIGTGNTRAFGSS